ncbi:hypothetical protein [Colwellia sp. UCD-KL20]|uniref:pilus assembly PilX family protein n=1 Tax=Colwellia sp. UCD-KL20 TaxID=1917165 RepID=UPI0009705034|nr:hypothetical protein [Colwellia sp. UCD-KL20]
MLLKQTLLITKNAQKGSSLVLAIFILVVMSLLGAALLRMMATNEETYVYEVLGTRAYNAAQTGAQRKLQQLFPLNTGLDSSMCTADDTFSLANIEGLDYCSVKVDCLEVKHENVSYFTVTSIGQCVINDEATSRVVEVQAKSMN